jgi:hypothetical protein
VLSLFFFKMISLRKARIVLRSLLRAMGSLGCPDCEHGMNENTDSARYQWRRGTEAVTRKLAQTSGQRSTPTLNNT